MSTLEDEVSRRTGRAVHRQRAARGFSLRQLATLSGLSPSSISDIERGAKSPTVATLARLAEALGVSAASLVDGGPAPAPRIRVLRQGEGPGGDRPVRWHGLLAAAPGGRLDFARYEIPPATLVGPSPAHAAGTVEHVHLISGRLRVTVGDEVVELAAGDGCSCRTDAPHAIENPDPATAAALYVIVERG